MSNNLPSVEILLTPRFQQDLRKLAKRYRPIRRDLTPFLDQLQQGKLLAIAFLAIDTR